MTEIDGAQSISPLLSKSDACAALGISERTLRNCIKRDEIPVSYLPGLHGKEARFDAADVERLKASRGTPIVQPDGSNVSNGSGQEHSGAQSTALAPLRQMEDFARLVLAIQNARTPTVPRNVWLTGAEAAALIGLPESYLERKARDGWVGAIDVGVRKGGRWRFSRRRLEEL
jgi:hypothetical protein